MVKNQKVFEIIVGIAALLLTTAVWAQVPSQNPSASPQATGNSPAAPVSAQNNTDALSSTLRNASTPTQNNTNNNQSAITALQNAPPLPPPPVMTEQEKQGKAFDNALGNVFPLSPEQVQEVMKRMTESQEAGRGPPQPDPVPVVKIENVSLDPGIAPPLIKVAAGYVTTVNILDITGQPWPIQDVVVGGNFQVTGPNDAQVLRIVPQTRFGRGNLSIRLVGLSTPLTFRVEAGGSQVYYRYDARVGQTGPAAKQPLIDNGYKGEAGDSTLMAVLAGVPPKDGRKLDLSGADNRTKAWKINERVYLRTPLTLLSPGWDASVSSADGVNVYMLQDSPVLMLSDNGQMVRAHVDIPPEDPFHTNDLKEGKVTVPILPPAPVPMPATGLAGSGVANPADPNGAAAAQAAAVQNAAAAAGASGTQANANAQNQNVHKIGGATIYTNGAYPSAGPTNNLNLNLGGSGL